MGGLLVWGPRGPETRAADRLSPDGVLTKKQTPIASRLKSFPSLPSPCYLPAVTADRPLEVIVVETAFAPLLGQQSAPFCRLANSLLAERERHWSKGDLYRLAHAANELESFLDDHGAKFNRSFSLIRELVASVRWLSLAGFSLSHLESRLESYGLGASLSEKEAGSLRASLGSSRFFLQRSSVELLSRLRQDFSRLGAAWDNGAEAAETNDFDAIRRRLPRNIGQDEPADDTQRIAEIASKYISACTMLEGLGIQRLEVAQDRRRKIAAICKEEQARVYEATVHNLQSTYDTYIKNTVVEAKDDRLPRLRGHLSAALHLLETTTVLAHFLERHELEVRGDSSGRAIASLVDGDQVQALMLNELLVWADILMQRGRSTAEALLPTYMELRELRVELPPHLKLHARPAALIVNIVAHHGTPVELEVDGKRCNAGSILEVLIAVGSHPEARTYVFRGDVKPLQDIGALFGGSLGEDGLENLPASLHYLRSR